MKTKTLVTLAAVTAVVLVGAARLKVVWDRNTSQTDAYTTNDVAVNVSSVARKMGAQSLTQTGTATAWKELDLASEVQGRIVALRFTLGQMVKAGTVLAEVEDTMKKAAYESARADAERLHRELERTENLFKGGTASEQETDKARSAYLTAKAALDQAAKQYNDTRITTSIGGSVVDKKVEVGTYVNQGTVIASVVDISRLKVKLNLSEATAYAVNVGQRATIRTDVKPGAIFQGRITFISPRGDDSHNYAAEVEMQNTAQDPIKSGTFVTIEIPSAAQAAGLYIPRQALQGSIKDAKVYVVSDGRTHLRSIVIGGSSTDELQVLSGLAENEQVVVSGQVNLTDDKPVHIMNSK
jgi:membrane fusion protein (multidrug efflux system)